MNDKIKNALIKKGYNNEEASEIVGSETVQYWMSLGYEWQELVKELTARLRYSVEYDSFEVDLYVPLSNNFVLVKEF
ncbi:MAG: hypothetical protein LBT91_02650 [Bifidobacteriaceae bacterium]|jgi:hypothetical protein|nr:hypothetical protein [Bifidobacteriaceae bacterium]